MNVEEYKLQLDRVNKFETYKEKVEELNKLISNLRDDRPIKISYSSPIIVNTDVITLYEEEVVGEILDSLIRYRDRLLDDMEQL